MLQGKGGQNFIEWKFKDCTASNSIVIHLQGIILNFRTIDLQNLLDYQPHLDRTKKAVLRERCLNLLKTANLASTEDKIRLIQRNL